MGVVTQTESLGGRLSLTPQFCGIGVVGDLLDLSIHTKHRRNLYATNATTVWTSCPIKTYNSILNSLNIVGFLLASRLSFTIGSQEDKRLELAVSFPPGDVRVAVATKLPN